MMIGVIGPEDSTALVQRVAHSEGLEDRLIVRSYEGVEESIAYATSLDPLVHVLLFTGWVPYAMAAASHDFRARLDFIPHGGVDLSRTLVMLARAHQGRIPSSSLDTIERSIVLETFEDLNITPPDHVLSLGERPEAADIREWITDYHVSYLTSGRAEVALTCLGSVHATLQRRRLPSIRVEHSRSSVRDALYRAQLALDLAISEATQIAIGVIRVPELDADSRSDSHSYDRQRLRLRVQEILLDHAQRLRGSITQVDPQTFVIHTTRGAIDDAWLRLAEGHSSALDFSTVPNRTSAGFGLGASVTGAEVNARRALVLAEQEGIPHLVTADGRAIRITRVAEGEIRLRETSEEAVRIARQLGLGPLALARLSEALRRLDSRSVTAQDLADAYGIEARSARRILIALTRAGMATHLGRQAGTRAGRPQNVYGIDATRLLQVATTDPERAGASTGP